MNSKLTSPFQKSPRIGFIGAGRLAQTLAVVWAEAGAQVIGANSRSAASALALTRRCEHATAFPTAQALADAADLIFLSVPDDAIANAVAQVRWRADQGVVHCSAATEISVLAPAHVFGAATGGFHPLQIFSDPELARHHLRGSTVAIEAEPALQETLEHLATIVGLKPIRLKPGVRVAYHLAGNFAASCLLGLLKEAEDLWVDCGMERADALPALLPLSFGTLNSAARLGLSNALAGPVSRGDSETLLRHLECASRRPAGDALYREVLQRLIALVAESNRLPAERVAALNAAVALGAKSATRNN